MRSVLFSVIIPSFHRTEIRYFPPGTDINSITPFFVRVYLTLRPSCLMVTFPKVFTAQGPPMVDKISDSVSAPSFHFIDTPKPPLARSPDTEPVFHDVGSAGKSSISRSDCPPGLGS